MDFEDATGITMNRIDNTTDALITRMKAMGVNSPVDVLLTVDTSRLARAQDADVFQPAGSDVQETCIPANIQDVDSQWFGLSQRMRAWSVTLHQALSLANTAGLNH